MLENALSGCLIITLRMHSNIVETQDTRSWWPVLRVVMLVLCLGLLAGLLVFVVLPAIDTWLNPPPLPPLQAPLML